MYVVTGGAGFIGSVLIWQLNSQGIDDIVVTDSSLLARSPNLKHLRYREIIDPAELLRRLEQQSFARDVQGIVHLGACTSTTSNNWDVLWLNNYLYTQDLARLALSHDLRFIYASSAATYGDGSRGCDDGHEHLARLKPLSLYGQSKHLFDLWALKNNVLDRMAGLKFFNVFGPHEYHKAEMTSMVYQCHQQIEQTGQVKLFKSYRDDYGHGQQMRDFVYVKDCADVIAWLLENRQVGGLFNVGSGRARSWNDLAHAVFDAVGKPSQIEYIDMPAQLRAKYQYFTEASITKLRSAGYPRPFTPLEDAVRDYVCGYLRGHSPYLVPETPSELRRAG